MSERVSMLPSAPSRRGMIEFSKIRVENLRPAAQGNESLFRVKLRVLEDHAPAETRPQHMNADGSVEWTEPIRLRVKHTNVLIYAVVSQYLNGGWSMIPSGRFSSRVAPDVLDVWRLSNSPFGPLFYAEVRAFAEGSPQNEDTSIPSPPMPPSFVMASSFNECGLGAIRGGPESTGPYDLFGPVGNTSSFQRGGAQYSAGFAHVHAQSATIPTVPAVPVDSQSTLSPFHVARTSSWTMGISQPTPLARMFGRALSGGSSSARFHLQSSGSSRSTPYSEEHSIPEAPPQSADIDALRSPVGTYRESPLLREGFPLQENTEETDLMWGGAAFSDVTAPRGTEGRSGGAMYLPAAGIEAEGQRKESEAEERLSFSASASDYSPNLAHPADAARRVEVQPGGSRRLGIFRWTKPRASIDGPPVSEGGMIASHARRERSRMTNSVIDEAGSPRHIKSVRRRLSRLVLGEERGATYKPRARRQQAMQLQEVIETENAAGQSIPQAQVGEAVSVSGRNSGRGSRIVLGEGQDAGSELFARQQHAMQLQEMIVPEESGLLCSTREEHTARRWIPEAHGGEAVSVAGESVLSAQADGTDSALEESDRSEMDMAGVLRNYSSHFPRTKYSDSSDGDMAKRYDLIPKRTLESYSTLLPQGQRYSSSLFAPELLPSYKSIQPDFPDRPRELQPPPRSVTAPDKVIFNCVSPPAVVGGQAFDLTVFAFLRQQRDDVLMLAQRREAVEVGIMPHTIPIMRDKRVAVKLELPENTFEVIPPEVFDEQRASVFQPHVREFFWTGQAAEANFMVRCRPKALIGTVKCSAFIIEGESVSRLSFHIEVLRAGDMLWAGDTEREFLKTTLEDVQPDVAVISPDELEILDDIGKGAQGETLLCNWKSAAGNRHVAVKRLAAGITNSPSAQPFDDLKSEAAILSLLGHHPHIVTFLGICRRGDRGDETVQVVTKYEEGGNIQDELARCGNGHNGRGVHGSGHEIDTHVRMRWARQLASALTNVHAANVVHNDVACRNALLSRKGANGDAVLCDFGVSRLLRWGGLEIASLLELEGRDPERKLPLRQMPKEALTPPHAFSRKSDAWMFGAMLYELFEGRTPFADLDTVEVTRLVREGKRPDIPETLSHHGPTLEKLFLDCLEVDSNLRPSMEDIVLRLDCCRNERHRRPLLVI